MTIIPPPIGPDDVVGTFNLSEAEETLLIMLLKRHEELCELYHGGEAQPELAANCRELEDMAHRVWREAGNEDRSTWEITVLLNRKYGGVL